MVVYRRDTRRRYVLALLVITSLVLISLLRSHRLRPATREYGAPFGVS